MDLDITYLTQQQHNAVVGHTIDYHHSIPSTMPLAHQLATQAATRSGTLVVADEQTAGRGRLDRRWEAPPGQALLVSIILKPPLPISWLASPPQMLSNRFRRCCVGMSAVNGQMTSS